MLCLLGQWCAEGSLADQAVAVLRRAQAARGPRGEHWLWVADLADLLQEEETAVAIERELLEADRLPVVRVPGLLDRVEVREGTASADRLATTVAAYSDHPSVLRRAIRAAGDTEAAAAYRDRLSAVAPGAVEPGDGR
jgi:hypothetical protein